MLITNQFKSSVAWDHFNHFNHQPLYLLNQEYQKAMELAKEEISRLKNEKEDDVKKVILMISMDGSFESARS